MLDDLYKKMKVFRKIVVKSVFSAKIITMKRFLAWKFNWQVFLWKWKCHWNTRNLNFHAIFSVKIQLINFSVKMKVSLKYEQFEFSRKNYGIDYFSLGAKIQIISKLHLHFQSQSLFFFSPCFWNTLSVLKILPEYFNFYRLEERVVILVSSLHKNATLEIRASLKNGKKRSVWVERDDAFFFVWLWNETGYSELEWSTIIVALAHTAPTSWILPASKNHKFCSNNKVHKNQVYFDWLQKIDILHFIVWIVNQMDNNFHAKNWKMSNYNFDAIITKKVTVFTPKWF